MLHFDTYTVKTVVCHPYRTARAFPIVMTCQLEEEGVTDWREWLAEKSGKGMDNHTVYEVTYENDLSLCFWFSDGKMRIALKLVKESW